MNLANKGTHVQVTCPTFSKHHPFLPTPSIYSDDGEGKSKPSPPPSMASSLLRRRSSPALNAAASHLRLQDVIKMFHSPLELKAGQRYGGCTFLFHFSSSSDAGKFDFTDMTRPHTWYQIARKKKRNVFLHVGPTNGGNTYHALKRMKSSSTG
ncbi:DExH-box ATP-dependent RNA helicase DExH16, mitochondrial-like protein [Drosera capensis]